jgi:hypothetical protein
MKKRALILLLLMIMSLMVLAPAIKLAHATITDQALMNILPFKSNPEYYNASQYSINYAANLDEIVISNSTIFQFNGTNLGSHTQCYAFLWKVQMEITGATYNNPASMTMNSQGYIIKKNGATTYVMDFLVDNYDLQTGLTLTVGIPYDLWTIVLFNNTASTTMLNSLAYDYGHGGDPAHLLANLTGGHAPGGWANPMHEMIGTSDYWYGWVANRSVSAEGLVSFNLTLQNSETNSAATYGQWVFVNQKYYDFNLSVSTGGSVSSGGGCNFTLIQLRFSTDTKDGNITNTISWDTENTTLLLDPSNTTAVPIQIQNCQAVNSSTTEYLDFRVWFNPDCTDQYLSPGVGILARAVWANGTDSGWQLVVSDFFHIYSQGGFTLSTTVGNYTNGAWLGAGKIVGGTGLDLYAYNNSMAESDLIFNNLEHIKLLPEVVCTVGYQTFYIWFGMDIATSESATWIPEWSIKIGADSVTYGTERYANLSLNWFNPYVYGGGANVTAKIALFHRGNAAGSGQITSWRYWVDLWFDKGNGSSVCGGRINAYEWAMQDNANAWLKWLSNNWGPMDQFAKQSMFLGDLKDENGNRLESSKIKLIRTWARVEVVPYTTAQQVYLSNYAVKDLTLGATPLEGIQEPAFDDTQMPAMPQGGLLGLIFSGFQAMGKWLADNVIYGGLNMWGVFVGFLDTVAGWFGAPHFFTDMFTWIGQGIGWLGSGMGYIFTLIYDIFLLIGSLMMGFLSTIGQLILSIVNTITFFTNMMSGAIGGAGNLWNQLGIMSWLTVFLVFYPIYLIILWEEEGTDAVVSQLTMIFGILSWLFQFFYQLALMMVNVIHTLIESIPVVE